MNQEETQHPIKRGASPNYLCHTVVEILCYGVYNKDENRVEINKNGKVQKVYQQPSMESSAFNGFVFNWFVYLQQRTQRCKTNLKRTVLLNLELNKC